MICYCFFVCTLPKSLQKTDQETDIRRYLFIEPSQHHLNLTLASPTAFLKVWPTYILMDVGVLKNANSWVPLHSIKSESLRPMHVNMHFNKLPQVIVTQVVLWVSWQPFVKSHWNVPAWPHLCLSKLREEATLGPELSTENSSLSNLTPSKGPERRPLQLARGPQESTKSR